MSPRILVVDDDADTVLFLCTFLQDEGYATAGALGAEQGFALLRADRPDLVLLDLQMPGSTGACFYRELKRDRELRDIPVVIVTGLGEFALFAEDCRPVPPPAAALQKPIDRAELLATIQRALGGAGG
ncbi:MAG TPA: response regulator [Polyangia bacterium]